MTKKKIKATDIKSVALVVHYSFLIASSAERRVARSAG